MILIANVDQNNLGKLSKEIIDKINRLGKILTLEYGNAINNIVKLYSLINNQNQFYVFKFCKFVF